MINFEINKKHIEKFNLNGFIVLDKFLDTTFIKNLKNKFEPLFRGKFETGIKPDEWNWKFGIDSNDLTRQICNAWKSDNLIKKLVCHSVIGKTCAILMNWHGARLIQDNILWKPPGGKSLGFHQDASYNDWVIPQTMMTCWMPLDDVSKESGTLEYVKGSHLWDLQPPKGEFHSPNDYKRELDLFADKNNKNIEIVHVNVPAGGVSFHHGYTWHGSGVNLSKLDRRVIVSHCVPSDAKFHPTNEGGTAKIYKKFKKENSDFLHDKYFPLIWKQK